jgi:hypothetical protein
MQSLHAARLRLREKAAAFRPRGGRVCFFLCRVRDDVRCVPAEKDLDHHVPMSVHRALFSDGGVPYGIAVSVHHKKGRLGKSYKFKKIHILKRKCN